MIELGDEADCYICGAKKPVARIDRETGHVCCMDCYRINWAELDQLGDGHWVESHRHWPVPIDES